MTVVPRRSFALAIRGHPTQHQRVIVEYAGQYCARLRPRQLPQPRKRARQEPAGCALTRRIAIDRTKLRQDARPASRAFGEAAQIVFLVRRVDAVVIKREADQKRIHAKPRAEGFDNRDRGAAAHDHRRFAPFGFERARGGLEMRRAGVEADRRRPAFMREADSSRQSANALRRNDAARR